MNKIFLGLIIVQITGGCTQNNAKFTYIKTTSNKSEPGMVIELAGDVELKLEEWQTYRVGIIGVGAKLHDGDLVRPAKGAKVVVMCSDGNIWRIPNLVPSSLRNGCVK